MGPALRVFHRGVLGGLVLAASSCGPGDYFPPPDSEQGWRRPADAAAALDETSVDVGALDEALELAKSSTKHGGLLVARKGWLVYEKYFGRGHADATPNLASVAKAFTSVSMGILLGERPELFPDGLDQQIYRSEYLPDEAFPPADPRRMEIRLGQLLSMSAGIRGNNPGIVQGRKVILDPQGPDGWEAMEDRMSLGLKGGERNAQTLWIEPGGGYSYATSSIHLVSTIVRHVTGRELEDFVGEKLAGPMGWLHWGWGYRDRPLEHTPGGGGIAPRPPDLLRFCYLLLREGRWGDRQVVPSEYVRMCGRRSPYNPHTNYSLQFEVNQDGAVEGVPADAFWKSGSGGHCIYVIPSLDLAFVKLGGRDEQYSARNTRVQTPPERDREYDGSRDGWRPTAEVSGADERLMRMVVAAVVER